VEHEPDLVVGVEADLDEMIATAERAGLTRDALGEALRRGGEAVDPSIIAAPSARSSSVRAFQAAAPCASMPTGMARSMLLRKRAQVVREIPRAQARRDGGHAAADVDAHGGRRDGAAHGDDRPDRRAAARVHVRHDGDVVRDPRQRRDVLELSDDLRVDLLEGRPELDGDVASVESWRTAWSDPIVVKAGEQARRRVAPEAEVWCAL